MQDFYAPVVTGGEWQTEKSKGQIENIRTRLRLIMGLWETNEHNISWDNLMASISLLNIHVDNDNRFHLGLSICRIENTIWQF